MDNTASCMIEVCDLHKHYKDVHVLRGISTTVAKGEVCAVIGPSGSGKSTFLRCLNRLEEASSGEIFINAQEITDPHLNLNKMRENIGMVFQAYYLLPQLTVAENIMLSSEITKQAKPDVGMLLEVVGLSAFHGKKRANQLSGGEQQRVAIARAIATEPPIILADEPTGNLDNENSKNIISLLKSMAHERQKCVIVVTHSEEIAAEADVRYVMSDGSLRAV